MGLAHLQRRPAWGTRPRATEGSSWAWARSTHGGDARSWLEAGVSTSCSKQKQKQRRRRPDLVRRPGEAWVSGDGRRDGEATGEEGPDLAASSWDGARSEEEEGLGVVSVGRNRDWAVSKERREERKKEGRRGMA